MNARLAEHLRAGTSESLGECGAARYSLCLFGCESLVDRSKLTAVPEEAMSQHRENAYVNVFGYSQSEGLH